MTRSSKRPRGTNSSASSTRAISTFCTRTKRPEAAPAASSSSWRREALRAQGVRAREVRARPPVRGEAAERGGRAAPVAQFLARSVPLQRSLDVGPLPARSGALLPARVVVRPRVGPAGPAQDRVRVFGRQGPPADPAGVPPRQANAILQRLPRAGERLAAQPARSGRAVAAPVRAAARSAR
jgi:hypothetical protein